MLSRGEERLVCPAHFQERINQVAGLNRYDQPNFKLAWAQTETRREGGEWDNEDGYFVGYRTVYLGDGHPHWMLLQWVDAGKSHEMPHLPAQSDVGFYLENKCPKTGLQILGEYPYCGSYKIALPLVAKWFSNGKLNVVGMPLSTEIIEMMIPMIRAAMTVSIQAKLMFMREQEEKDDREYAYAVEDCYKSVKLPDHVKTSKWVADREREMEKVFNAALVSKLHRDRQFQRRTALR